MNELNDNILISVIICTYNRATMLDGVLCNLLNQEETDRFAYEVLVIDNNSKDDTKRVVDGYSKSNSGVFRYIFEQRQGKTYALNTGIRAAQGEILAFTDDDVVIDSRWLQSIARAVEQYPYCRAFGGRVFPIWPAKVPSWIVQSGPYQNTGSALVDHNKGDAIRSYHEHGMFVPCGANMFFRRDLFKDYHGFREDLNLKVKNIPMCEDTELCDRLMRGGEEILYIPHAIVNHPVFEQRLTKKYFRENALKSGRAFALMNEDIASYRKLLGVPCHICSLVVENFSRYLLAVASVNMKRSFFYQLKLIYYLGSLYEYFCSTGREHGN